MSKVQGLAAAGPSDDESASGTIQTAEQPCSEQPWFIEGLEVTRACSVVASDLHFQVRPEHAGSRQFGA